MSNLPLIVRGLEVEIIIAGDDDGIGANASEGSFQIALVKTVLADVR